MTIRPAPLLITGGMGFIGSNFVLQQIHRYKTAMQGSPDVVTLDALTYAGNLHNLRSLRDNPRHLFIHGNILDQTMAHLQAKKRRVFAFFMSRRMKCTEH